MTTEERLEKMEIKLKRAMRYNRILLAVVLLAVAAMIAGLNVSKKEVRANTFIVEDNNGVNRGIFSVIEGNPTLSLSDEKGKNRAMLSVIEGEPGLSLLDANGKARAGLAVIKDGPGLGLSDENGKLRVFLDVDSLILFKPDGKVLWKAPP